MAKARIAGKTQYIPDSIVEGVARLHGAFDPDTGHIVCHHYSFGAVAIEAGGRVIPGLIVGECLIIVYGERNVAALVDGARRVPLDGFSQEYADTGDVRVDAAHLALVLSLLRDAKARVTFYTITLEDDGSEKPALVVVLQDPESDVSWAGIVTGCSKSQPALSGGLHV